MIKKDPLNLTNMASEQCQCGQPLSVDNQCSCDPELCKNCCQCEPGCQCGCQDE